MMGTVKNIVFLLSVFLISYQGINAQTGNGQLNSLEDAKIPQERVFLHYNTTLLFVGEYLYYKAYVLNESTKELSALSKVVYVELVNEELHPIFKHKLYLERSSAQGDFFIPTNIPSGHYKLIAYTQWMRNGDKAHFFQGNLSIVNPYQSDQNTIERKQDVAAISTKEDKNNSFVTQRAKEYQSPFLELSLDKTSYKNRAKVILGLHTKNTVLLGGTYSLAVRKGDSINTPNKPSARDFVNDQIKESKVFMDSKDVRFLPELRGELISGQVTANDGKSAVADINVALSIPEEKGFQLKVVGTDATGSFIANFDKAYTSSKAHVQVLGDNKADYAVRLKGMPPITYPKMDFEGITITPDMEGLIVERSVHNQIENGYFSVKPDSLVPVPVRFPFDKGIMTTYNLDDYKRFSTIRETLVEVIDQVWTKRMDENKSQFQIMPYQYDNQLPNLNPLVVMDGIPVQDQTQLADYNARDVQTIGFIRDKYVIGPKIFQGVLNFETIDRDYSPFYSGNHSIVVDLVPPEPRKQYYQQKYVEGVPSKLLDFRYQLLWEPNLTIDKSEIFLEFFTSDLKGDFEILIEGFAKDGTPISLREIFSVE